MQLEDGRGPFNIKPGNLEVVKQVVVALAVRNNWLALTAGGGGAGKFDCLEFRDADKDDGKGRSCHWVVEQPPGQVLQGLPASVSA